MNFFRELLLYVFEKPIFLVIIAVIAVLTLIFGQHNPEGPPMTTLVYLTTIPAVLLFKVTMLEMYRRRFPDNSNFRAVIKVSVFFILLFVTFGLMFASLVPLA